MAEQSATPGVLSRLAETFEVRKRAAADSSYVAGLFARGEDAILKKVGEEAVEFVLAAKGSDNDHLVAEAADVWFHMLVLLSHKGLGPVGQPEEDAAIQLLARAETQQESIKIDGGGETWKRIEQRLRSGDCGSFCPPACC